MLSLKTSKQTVTQFAFSADGSRLAVAGSGRKVHLWDMTAKKLKATTLPTFGDAVVWVGFLSSGKLFALSLMGEYAVYDPIAGTTDCAALLKRWWVGHIVAAPSFAAFYGTGREVRKWAFDGRLREVWNEKVQKDGILAGRGGAVLTPEGTLLTAVSNMADKTWLHTRDSATGAFQGEQFIAQSLIRNLTLLPDGRTLAFVREKQYGGPTPNALVVGTAGRQFEAIHLGTPAVQFTALALHPSGRWLAVGQSDGTVRTFDTGTWAEASAHQWSAKPINGLAFAPDGLKAAAGVGNLGEFVVWDVDV